MLPLIRACFMLVLFLAVGTAFLFFPTRILRMVGQWDKRFYTWFYRDYGKIPEALKWKIERATECPEEAEVTMCGYRVAGVFCYLGALLASVVVASVIKQEFF